MEAWHVPSEPSPLPHARRVLVLAPHPDDEVFGTGGAIALYVAQRARLRVVIVTDGGAQAPPGADWQASLTGSRAEESRKALAILGVDDIVFAGLQDRRLTASAALADLVERHIQEVDPDVVLAPSLWEVHPDHVAVGLAAARALARDANDTSQTSRARELLMYEVGGAQRVNMLLDITGVWPVKALAIGCFTSQQQRQDYARHIESLNAWRTYTLPSAVRYAEGYTRITQYELPAFLNGQADPLSAFLRLVQDDSLHRVEATQEDLRQQLAHSQETVRLSEAAFAALRHDHERESLAAREALQRAVLAEADVAKLNGYLQRIQASTSWRITAPLRWISRHLRSW